MAGTCNVACAEGDLSLARQRARIDPNILWLTRVESPSNCVFFACHPYTPAVLTSSGPRFGLPCI